MERERLSGETLFAFDRLPAATLWGSGPDYDRARKLYNLTEFEQSLKVLQAIPSKGRRGVGADRPRTTTGRRLQEGHRGAGEGGRGGSGQLGDLLVAGPGLRTPRGDLEPVHRSRLRLQGAPVFRKGAQLNPNNLDAQSDLFEYYLEAPGFLGGGLDKAQATAERDGAAESGRGPLGAGQAGRKAQGILQRRRAPAPRHRSGAAPGGPLHRPGPAVHQTGTLPGGRPESGAKPTRSRRTARS